MLFQRIIPPCFGNMIQLERPHQNARMNTVSVRKKFNNSSVKDGYIIEIKVAVPCFERVTSVRTF